MDEESDNCPRCKCCLEESDLKNLWKEYRWDGEKEIYGKMIAECFEFQWAKPVNREEYICETCVVRLRDAFEFKNQVLLIENELQFKVLADQKNKKVKNHLQNTGSMSNEEKTGGHVIIAYGDNGGKFEHVVVKKETGPDDYMDFEYLNDDNVERDDEISTAKDKKIANQKVRSVQRDDQKNAVINKILNIKEEVDYEEVEYLDFEEVVNESEKDGVAESLNVSEFKECYKRSQSMKINDAIEHSEEDINQDGFETLVLYAEGDEDIDDETISGTTLLHEGVNYEEVDYIIKADTSNTDKNDADISTKRKKEKSKWTEIEHNNESQEETKKKWPKRDRKAERLRGYKQYTVEDLRKSLETVKSGKWTQTQASAIYNVPRKTISAYIRKFKNITDPQDFRKHLRDDKQQGLIEEIKQILIYTNATPYKTTTSLFYCVYCYNVKNAKHFDDPAELRKHTRVEHAGERTTAVDQFMRPHWLNEILKLDIADLICTVCCTMIPGWNDMFSHLQEYHNVELDEAYTKVVPYSLGPDMNCALCKQSYPNYHYLDTHMNAHYNNYMCDECGDTFITESRLKKHARVHVTQRHPCEDCGKVFRLAIYKRKHHDLVHKKNIKIKCLYCDLRFPGELQRHSHVLECHQEKVKYFTCELCGRTFDWKPYYYGHIRKKHKKKMVKCKYCDVVCNSIREIKKHEATHKEPVRHECKICNKTYCTTTYLKQHYWISHGKMVETKKKLHKVL